MCFPSYLGNKNLTSECIELNQEIIREKKNGNRMHLCQSFEL